MTEAEWWAARRPDVLLEFLRPSKSRRKYRLFAVACCRSMLARVSVDPPNVRAIDVAERYADGESTGSELEQARPEATSEDTPENTPALACAAAADPAGGNYLAIVTAANAAWAYGEHIAAVANPFRVGDPVDDPVLIAAREEEAGRQVAFLRDIFGPLPFRDVRIDPSWLTSDVTALARGIYDDKAFDRMPILADALQDAGCDHDELLAHCREPGREHVRGCWVVDLILGKPWRDEPA